MEQDGVDLNQYFEAKVRELKNIYRSFQERLNSQTFLPEDAKSVSDIFCLLSELIAFRDYNTSPRGVNHSVSSEIEAVLSSSELSSERAFYEFLKVRIPRVQSEEAVQIWSVMISHLVRSAQVDESHLSDLVWFEGISGNKIGFNSDVFRISYRTVLYRLIKATDLSQAENMWQLWQREYRQITDEAVTTQWILAEYSRYSWAEPALATLIFNDVLEFYRLESRPEPAQWLFEFFNRRLGMYNVAYAADVEIMAKDEGLRRECLRYFANSMEHNRDLQIRCLQVIYRPWLQYLKYLGADEKYQSILDEATEFARKYALSEYLSI